jgi:hypothetical protein
MFAGECGTQRETFNGVDASFKVGFSIVCCSPAA